jgi:membrane-associated phospholipid phosphatase
MQNLNYKSFRAGIALSFFTAIILLALSFWLGKNELFLMLNGDLGIVADYFFAIWTNAGDGVIWLIVLIIILKMKRKDVLPLIISGFVVSTVITQVFKYFIIPNELRPYKAIADRALIHTVSFVEPYTTSSFPSGHTGAAFSFFLLFCLILHKNWWIWSGFAGALLVGYSRVYLAQHFPLDVAGGIIVAVATAAISVQVQKFWMRKKAVNRQPATDD